jgi:four helix bundle protein
MFGFNLNRKNDRTTEKFPKTELYGLISQMRRAAVSVASNIAEGASRSSAVERKRFYEIARSSLVEIDTQLEISLSLKYCMNEDLALISDQMNHIFAMLSRMITKTK